MALSRELDYQVEALLAEWWPWESGYRGGPHRVVASSIYQATRNRSGYDSAVDLIAESIDHVKLEAIGASVGSLARDYREAVNLHWLNATTARVWRSQRFAPERIEELYLEAKALLVPMFRARHIEI